MTNLALRGTNVAGGDNYFAEWGSNGPVQGTNYLWVTTKEVDYQLGKGATFFRVLFGWESMQRTAGGALDATYLAGFKAVVDYATSKGATVLIDVHGGDAQATGAAYYGVKIPGGYGGMLVSDGLANLWGRLAAVFKSNPRVKFGLMNEPNGTTTAAWFACAQKCINSIRLTGSINTIVAPGANWTGASDWVSGGNAAAFLGLTDPADNLVFQVHEYLDPDGGGGTNQIVSATIGVDRISAAVSWARANGKRLFLAEIGFSASSPLAVQAAANLFGYLNANSDVVLGWAWWAYGPIEWWQFGTFSICPTPDFATDSPQMKLIAPYLAAPVVEPPVTPPPTDPTVAALQALVASLQAQVTSLQTQVATLTSSNSGLLTNLNSETSYANALLAKITNAKAALA